MVAPTRPSPGAGARSPLGVGVLALALLVPVLAVFVAVQLVPFDLTSISTRLTSTSISTRISSSTTASFWAQVGRTGRSAWSLIFHPPLPPVLALVATLCRIMSIIFLIPLVGLILFDVASYAVFRTLGLRHIRVRVRSRRPYSSDRSSSRPGRSQGPATLGDRPDQSSYQKSKSGNKVVLQPETEAESGLGQGPEPKLELEPDPDPDPETGLKPELDGETDPGYVLWPGPHAHIYTHTRNCRSSSVSRSGSRGSRPILRRRGETAPLLPPGTYDAAAVRAWGKNRPRDPVPLTGQTGHASSGASSPALSPDMKPGHDRQGDPARKESAAATTAGGSPSPHIGPDGAGTVQFQSSRDHDQNRAHGLVPNQGHNSDRESESFHHLRNQHQGPRHDQEQAIPKDACDGLPSESDTSLSRNLEPDHGQEPEADQGHEPDEDLSQLTEEFEDEPISLAKLASESLGDPIGVQGALGFDAADFEADSDASESLNPGPGVGKGITAGHELHLTPMQHPETSRLAGLAASAASTGSAASVASAASAKSAGLGRHG